MCDTCGCSDKNHQHEHHSQEHSPGHHHSHRHEESQTRTVKLEQNVLRRNEEAAEQNSKWLKERQVRALNFISSPGSGKTTLLEKTLESLREKGIFCGVIVGDQQTDLDAQRLSGKGALVRQIETINSCHLDAERVGALFEEVVGEKTRLLFIENVGNLICPAAFNLGEECKVVLLSVTEGEDKPLKYPVVFSRSKVVLLTKMDLAPHVDWDRQRCIRNVRHVAPGARIIELSAKSGQGMDEWLEYLL